MDSLLAKITKVIKDLFKPLIVAKAHLFENSNVTN